MASVAMRTNSTTLTLAVKVGEIEGPRLRSKLSRPSPDIHPFIATRTLPSSTLLWRAVAWATTKPLYFQNFPILCYSTGQSLVLRLWSISRRFRWAVYLSGTSPRAGFDRKTTLDPTPDMCLACTWHADRKQRFTILRVVFWQHFGITQLVPA